MRYPVELADSEMNHFLTPRAVEEHVRNHNVQSFAQQGEVWCAKPNRRFVSRYIQSVYNDTIELVIIFIRWLQWPILQIM